MRADASVLLRCRHGRRALSVWNTTNAHGYFLIQTGAQAAPFTSNDCKVYVPRSLSAPAPGRRGRRSSSAGSSRSPTGCRRATLPAAGPIQVLTNDRDRPTRLPNGSIARVAFIRIPGGWGCKLVRN